MAVLNNDQQLIYDTLTAILLGYSEYSQLKLYKDERLLSLGFALKKPLNADYFIPRQNRIIDSILAYNNLQATGKGTLRLLYDSIMVYIVRDIATLTNDEIKLLPQIMKEEFGDNLVDNFGTPQLIREDKRGEASYCLLYFKDVDIDSDYIAFEHGDSIKTTKTDFKALERAAS